ncbi:MAG: toxin-antitoxin system YwqK family antitoxin [Flavobacteriaceae bacterium]|nr:toxin-antitoxin system YwqK family antitoxin [Bacteroidia bacterium]NNL61116.1 toxin-antitoxin system YwqK family antitoxin [Flavobacteriaceae bacterium]
MSNVFAQQSYNQFDNDGKRHGIWKKNFEDTKQLRYQGEFNHGKEVGLFKFYKLVKKKSVLTATKLFNSDSDISEVTFLATNGNIISKGKMNGKKYVGEWLYYHNDSDKVMTQENYNDDGLLHGDKSVYFNNGQLAEHMSFVNGKAEGNAKNYTEKGIVIKDFNYKNGEMHGSYKDYTPKGELIVEGQFKNGKKNSIWRYYENGELQKEKNYSNPKTFHKN